MRSMNQAEAVRSVVVRVVVCGDGCDFCWKDCVESLGKACRLC